MGLGLVARVQENRDGADQDRIDHLPGCFATSTTSDPCIVSSYPKGPGGVSARLWLMRYLLVEFVQTDWFVSCATNDSG